MALAAWLGAGLIVSSTSRAIWSDTFALTFCFAGLYVFVRVFVAKRATRHWPFLLAALLSLAFMMKPFTRSLGDAGPSRRCSRPRSPLRAKASFAATCVAFAILFGATSFATYGAVLPPYFAPARVESSNLAHIFGVLFSPSRGLLWFMPSSLLLCFTPLFVWRDRRLLFWRALSPSGAVIGAISSISGFPTWWGGCSYGPRLFQFALPAVALLALIMAKAAGQMGKTGAGRIALPVLRRGGMGGFRSTSAA